MKRSALQWLSVVINDLPRYSLAFARGDQAYLGIRNRYERLQRSPEGNGYRCDWQWTSDLHAPKIVPLLGKILMRRALADHPIACSRAPVASRGTVPQISFVIGHRGEERLPHLLATLESIAGQQDASVECLVIEQDCEPRIAHKLPAWVRYFHTPPPTPNLPYCRSWAFNIGARLARGPVLALHDNDMLVPSNYAASILDRVNKGFEVVNLKRFIFYLSEAHTSRIFSGGSGLTDDAPLSVVQNLEGGGSVAIVREAYDKIGGLDESFIGWGGEDNEFWERAQTLKVWPYTFLPIVHLWHPPQPGKAQQDNHTFAHYQALSATPVVLRISKLRSLATGQYSGPASLSSDGN